MARVFTLILVDFISLSIFVTENYMNDFQFNLLLLFCPSSIQKDFNETAFLQAVNTMPFFLLNCIRKCRNIFHVSSFDRCIVFL